MFSFVFVAEFGDFDEVDFEVFSSESEFNHFKRLHNACFEAHVVDFRVGKLIRVNSI